MIRIREVTDEDCRLLWEWVSDPVVRSSAFQSRTIAWEDHTAWFRAKRNDPNCYMYVVLDQWSQPVGQVRFDVQPSGEAEVGISIAPGRRGQGYGMAALRLGCERLLTSACVTLIVAYIKPDNLASLRLFEKAGFTRDGVERVHDQEAVRMILPPPT